jgi:hypothetical protein
MQALARDILTLQEQLDERRAQMIARELGKSLGAK